MKSIQDLKYGHAMCPHCCQYFDVATTQLHLTDSRVPDKALFFLCRECQGKAEAADAVQLKAISMRCLDNIYEGRGNRTWAVTTELALLINGGDPAAAIKYGHGIPRSVYESLITDGGEIYRPFPPIHITVEGCKE